MKIAEKIKKLRIQQKMTQEQFAKFVGITQKTLSFWEKGINEPKQENLVIIRNKFNLDKEYFDTKNVIDFQKAEIFLQLQQIFNLSDEQLNTIELLITSNSTLGLINTFIEALKGNSEAKNAIIGILNCESLAKTFIENNKE